MTEDNYNTESWTANKTLDKPENEDGAIFAFVISLLSWIMQLFKFLQAKFNK